jgi:hypothetical protein
MWLRSKSSLLAPRSSLLFMKYRKLRIAWSVAWGVLAFLLLAFWARSYYRLDWLVSPSFRHKNFEVMSVRGSVHCDRRGTDVLRPWSWSSYTNPRISDKPLLLPEFRLPPYVPITADNSPISTIQIVLKLGPLGFGGSVGGVVVPHWFLVAMSTALGVAPWFRWRFSLQMLLMVITLVALGLGWIVYEIRI